MGVTKTPTHALCDTDLKDSWPFVMQLCARACLKEQLFLSNDSILMSAASARMPTRHTHSLMVGGGRL